MSSSDHPVFKVKTSPTAYLSHSGRGWCPRCQGECLLLDDSEGSGPFSRYDGYDLDERDYGYEAGDD